MYILVYVVVWRIGDFNLAFASRLRIFGMAREYLPEVVRSHVIQIYLSDLILFSLLSLRVGLDERCYGLIVSRQIQEYLIVVIEKLKYLHPMTQAKRDCVSLYEPTEQFRVEILTEILTLRSTHHDVMCVFRKVMCRNMNQQMERF